LNKVVSVYTLYDYSHVEKYRMSDGTQFEIYNFNIRINLLKYTKLCLIFVEERVAKIDINYKMITSTF
jgi:hypothetical protein